MLSTNLSCSLLELYWLSGLLYVFINLFYGTGQVFFNAFLPILVKSHPDYVRCKSKTHAGDEDQRVFAEGDRLGNWMSSRAFMTHYFAGVIMLVASSGVVMVLKGSETLALRIGVAISGIWCFLFLGFPAKYLRSRPGNRDVPKKQIDILSRSAIAQGRKLSHP